MRHYWPMLLASIVVCLFSWWFGSPIACLASGVGLGFVILGILIDPTVLSVEWKKTDG